MTPKQKIDLQAILTVAHHDYEKGLNSHAFFKVHSHAVGEDLVQDTFLKTWKYLVKRGKIDLMRAFLYHVLNNLIIDQYRKHTTTSLDLLLEGGFEPSADESHASSGSNADRLFNTLDGKAATLLIARLPAKYQRVMRMRYVQELTLKEIALITGQTRNTVAVQAHRGLMKLKALYTRT